MIPLGSLVYKETSYNTRGSFNKIQTIQKKRSDDFTWELLRKKRRLGDQKDQIIFLGGSVAEELLKQQVNIFWLASRPKRPLCSPWVFFPDEINKLF